MSVILLVTIISVALTGLGLIAGLITWLWRRATDWEKLHNTLDDVTKANNDNTTAIKDLTKTVQQSIEKQMAMFFEYGFRISALERYNGNVSDKTTLKWHSQE